MLQARANLNGGELDKEPFLRDKRGKDYDMDVKEEDKRECSDTGRSRSPPLGRPCPIGVHPGPPLSEPS